MATQSLQLWTATSALLAVIACGDKPAEPAPATPATEPAPTAAPAPAPAPSTALPAIPDGAKVYFIEPQDGAKVQGPLQNGKVEVAVKMGADSITVKPAGQIESGSGHHHILIDTTPDPEGAVVAKDEQHQHYGQGQTEATLSLTPGEHTLQLQLADGIHRSYGPKLAQTIKITVAEGVPAAATKAAAATDKANAKDTDVLNQFAKEQEIKNANAGKKKPEANPKASDATAQGHGH